MLTAITHESAEGDFLRIPMEIKKKVKESMARKYLSVCLPFNQQYICSFFTTEDLATQDPLGGKS